MELKICVADNYADSEDFEGQRFGAEPSKTIGKAGRPVAGKIGVLLFGLIFCGIALASASGLTGEDYTVYRTVIRDFYQKRDPGRTFLVGQRLVGMEESGHIRESIEENTASFSVQASDDLLNRIAKSSGLALENRFGLPGVILYSKKTKPQVPGRFFENVRTVYPDYGGKLTLSAPGYDRTHRTCLVYGIQRWSEQGAGSTLFLLRRQPRKQSWRLDKAVSVWKM